MKRWSKLAAGLAKFLAGAIFLLLSSALFAGDVAAFDLVGPRVQVRVTRDGITLPIAEVPNLREGDRLWIHPGLPDDQKARYVMVVAFLRGATNPPPDSWFIRSETWERQVHEEGITITVPNGAQQALIFLAPRTGGDFATLRSAVQGKPGAFVRAAQDLQLLSLNRARLEKYLAAIRESDELDPKTLHDRAILLARSLSIKVDEACFTKPQQQQASCLMQNSDQLVLDDGHGQSMVSAIAQSGGTDLVGAITTTRAAGSGAYSPYVGVVVDLAKMMENLHTAKYQYISALALPQGDELHLRLNTPPNFHKPQSVIVIGLPVVQPPVLPQLHAAGPEEIRCAQNPQLVLPGDGAPLVFSGEMAHRLVLHVESKDGHAVNLPVTANALQGGFVPAEMVPALEWLPLSFEATLRGEWGFDPFTGPTYKLQRSDSGVTWKVGDDDRNGPVAGSDRTLLLHSPNAVCVEQITFRPATGEARKAEWKLKSEQIEIHLPLAQAPAGDSALVVKQFGLTQAAEVPLRIYEEACRLEEFEFHTGDAHGQLKGSCLDRVQSLEVFGVHFKPAEATPGPASHKPLTMLADAAPRNVKEAPTMASALLLDGRKLEVKVVVLPPRPRVTLLAKVIEPAASLIHLGGQEDLPVDGRLHFRLRSEVPTVFAPEEKIEVASVDGFYHAELTLENGGLMRQNQHTLMATLELPRRSGASAFGPMRFRPVSPEGYAGDWLPLVTLVRLPEITDVRCPAAREEPCWLSGGNLFLVESIASDADFQHAVTISESALSDAVPVPRPHGRQLYLKLRDDPSVVHTLELPQKKDAATHRDDKPATASPAPAAVLPTAQNTVPAQSVPAATQSLSAPAKTPAATPPPVNSPHP
jgi:hypothetical protein